MQYSKVYKSKAHPPNKASKKGMGFTVKEFTKKDKTISRESEKESTPSIKTPSGI